MGLNTKTFSKEKSNRLFRNKHLLNIAGMFFLSFLISIWVSEIKTFTAFDFGRSLPFVFFSMVIPHTICLITLFFKWMASKKIWEGYYAMTWAIWVLWIVMNAYLKLISQTAESYRDVSELLIH